MKNRAIILGYIGRCLIALGVVFAIVYIPFFYFKTASIMDAYETKTNVSKRGVEILFRDKKINKEICKSLLKTYDQRIIFLKDVRHSDLLTSVIASILIITYGAYLKTRAELNLMRENVGAHRVPADAKTVEGRPNGEKKTDKE